MSRNSSRAPDAHNHDHHKPDQSRPNLTVDWELYARMLDESDWDEAQRKELILCLWSIVVGFVDLGFAVHPVQQALETKPDEACGQLPAMGALPVAELIDFSGEEQSPCS